MMRTAPCRRRTAPCCPRTGLRLTLPALLLLALVVTGCNTGLSSPHRAPPIQVLHLGAIVPTTGVDGPLGRAVLRGIEVAVRRHIRPARRYRLALVTVNEAGLTPASLGTALQRQRVLGVVGVLQSADALALTPAVERQRIVTISPVPMSPAPTAAHQTRGAGQAPSSFFPLSATAAETGQAAANLAVGPPPSLDARTVFVVDDGSRPGQTLAGAFADALAHKGGVIAGRASSASGDPVSVQRVVNAIIEVRPDLVFYAGGTATGASLRRTLSLTGAPLLRILTAGSIAGHPGWTAAVGGRAIAAHTIGIVPVPDTSALPGAKRFQAAYRRAFPGLALSPLTAWAYDAATDEIEAMQGLIHAGKRVTRDALGAAVARSHYRGVTGPLVLRQTRIGTPKRFHRYSCDPQGVWHDQGIVL